MNDRRDAFGGTLTCLIGQRPLPRRTQAGCDGAAPPV